MKKVILCLLVLASITFSQPIEFWGGCTSEMTVEDVQLLHSQGEVVNTYYSKSDYTRYIIKDLTIGHGIHNVQFQFDSLTNKLSFIRLVALSPSEIAFESIFELLVIKYGKPLIKTSCNVIWIVNGAEINLFFLHSRITNKTIQGVLYKPAPDTGLL